jgi:hypothetical protein
MTDFDLRFPDEKTARELIGSALNANREAEDGSTVIACFTHDHAIDLIGIIYKPAVLDSNGVEITPAKAVTGWHVNVRLLHDQELPAVLVPFIINPKTPSRVWF